MTRQVILGEFREELWEMVMGNGELFLMGIGLDLDEGLLNKMTKLKNRGLATTLPACKGNASLESKNKIRKF